MRTDAYTPSELAEMGLPLPCECRETVTQILAREGLAYICVDCQSVTLQRDSQPWLGVSIREFAMRLIQDERTLQIRRYGTNADTPLGFGSSLPWLLPYGMAPAGEVCAAFRHEYAQYESYHGTTTWMHLIREEVAELFETDDFRASVHEAVQVAALCVSLIEHLLVENKEVGV